MPSNPRFEARSAMLCCLSISEGARLLYLVLDDMARDRGSWFIKQEELAVRMGIRRAEAQRRLYELRDAGHLTLTRTGRSSVATLAWTKSANPVGISAEPHPYGGIRGIQAEASDASIRMHRPPLGIDTGTYTPVQTTVRTSCCWVYFEEEPAFRCSCGRIHYQGNYEASEVVIDHIVETRSLLHQYVRQSGLQWDPPDAKVCELVLRAAGGLVPLYPWLRGLIQQRMAPKRSYMWFVAVLAKQSGRVSA